MSLVRNEMMPQHLKLLAYFAAAIAWQAQAISQTAVANAFAKAFEKELSGTVLDPAKKPVPMVVVSAECAQGRFVAVTDKDGKFFFDLPGDCKVKATVRTNGRVLSGDISASPGKHGDAVILLQALPEKRELNMQVTPVPDKWKGSPTKKK